MNSLLRDLRFAVRTLGKNPKFAVLVVLTLALGIGASTAMFSVVDGVLLRPLPYPEPDRLVQISEQNFERQQFNRGVSPANFVDWKQMSTSFEGMAAIGVRPFNLSGETAPKRILAMLVTADFFPTLAARPALGRLFSSEEYESEATRAYAQVSPQQSESAGVAVITHQLWQRQFAGDPEIIGRRVELDGIPTTVIGVMPDGFDFDEVSGWGKVDLWIPQSYRENENPRARYLTVIARLGPSIVLERAQSEMDSVAQQLERRRPEENTGWTVRIASLHEVIVGDARQQILLIFGGVVLVLLIACANVMNLLLTRAANRIRETGIRACLGASRWQIIRQLLVESLVLASLAGLVGTVLAIWGLDVLRTLAPEDLPRLEEVAVDGRVLAFTLLLSLVTAVPCGIVPALRSSRKDLTTILKEGGTASTGERRRIFSKTLVVTQVALSLLLLAASGLLLHSFLSLRAVDLGFDYRNVLTFQISPGFHKYRHLTEMIGFKERVIDVIQDIPGVQSVAVGQPPLRAGGASGYFLAEGQTEPEVCLMDAPSPQYFRTLHIPLLQGRMFDRFDRDDAEPVAVLNQAAANFFFREDNPVGEKIAIVAGKDSRTWLTVVGIVGDIRATGIEAEPQPIVFLPMHQSQVIQSNTFLIRTDSDPMRMLPQIQSAAWSIDPDVPLSHTTTLEQRLSSVLIPWKFRLFLVGSFSSLAFLMAALGVYGVVSQTVVLRTHEIGIRMAVGADRHKILRLILLEGIALVGIGLVLGLAGALLLSSLLSSFVYGVSTTDPLSYASVVLTWIIVAFLASYIPARRATSIDPMRVLKYE